jgi:hypothetical protein
MKVSIYILKLSVWILLVFLALYITFFCTDNGEIDPIEVEMIGFVFFVVLGIILGRALRRRAGLISPVIYWILFVLYLLTFTLPALISSCIVILYMKAG